MCAPPCFAVGAPTAKHGRAHMGQIGHMGHIGQMYIHMYIHTFPKPGISQEISPNKKSQKRPNPSRLAPRLLSGRRFSRWQNWEKAKKINYKYLLFKKFIFFAIFANNRVWCACLTIFDTVISHPFFWQTFWARLGSAPGNPRNAKLPPKKSRRAIFSARVFLKFSDFWVFPRRVAAGKILGFWPFPSGKC